MEYDASTRSTSPDWRNGSRLSEIVSFHVMSSGAMPSEAARILPISGSKPTGMSSVAPLKPMPGWSNLTPMMIVARVGELLHARAVVELVGGVLGHLDVDALAAVVAGVAAGGEREGEAESCDGAPWS